MSPQRAPFPGEDALSNADLGTRRPASKRTWGLWHFAALWVGMSVCIPTYMLAASMIASGLNWWQSLAIILLGNAIVLLPMIVTGHAAPPTASRSRGVARASYGVRGAHLPALLRSMVACGWFGIQTWVGGLAISALLGSVWPAWLEIGGGARFMGHGAPEFLGFLLFWLVNLFFDLERHRVDQVAGDTVGAVPDRHGARAAGVGGSPAPVDWAWALEGVESTGPDPPAQQPGGFFVGTFVPWLTAMVGYWATLALNIPDFTRFARTAA